MISPDEFIYIFVDVENTASLLMNLQIYL